MSLADLPKQYDPQDAQRRWYALWLEKGYFHADPSSHAVKPAVHHRHPAAERHRGVAPGARAEQYDPGYSDPIPPHAGVRRPLDARHRPRGDRHPGGRRAAADGGGEEDAARPRARGARRTHLGVEGRVREAHPQPVAADGLLVRLGTHALHAGRDVRAGRPHDVLQPVSGRQDLSGQAARQLGYAAPHGRRRRRNLL